MPDTPVLLVSLGTSPALIPEAFLRPEVRFAAGHVLTTASVNPAVTGLVATRLQQFLVDHLPAAAGWSGARRPRTLNPGGDA